MEKESDPAQIYRSFVKNQLSVEKATRLLLSLIEQSENYITRKKCVEFIGKVNYFSELIFNSLENIAVSDESAHVRRIALREIISKYYRHGYDVIKWSISNDDAPQVLNSIYFSLKGRAEISSRILLNLLESRLKQIGRTIGVNREEAVFFLELESILASNYKNYLLNDNFVKFYKLIQQPQGRYPWLMIRNGKVDTLKLNFFNWLYIRHSLEHQFSIARISYPKMFFQTIRNFGYLNLRKSRIPYSIVLLRSLKHLDLGYNDLRRIPFSICRLISLEKLILKQNKIKSLPRYLKNLVNLKELDLTYNQINNIPPDIRDLPLVEITSSENQS